MSSINYDPLKDRFSRLIGRSACRRNIFYFLLDMMFLRSWYVRKLVKKYVGRLPKDLQWSLLDAGSGFGQYDRFILESFPQVTLTAFDIKDNYLQECRRFFRKEVNSGRAVFVRHDLEELAEQNKYDLIICVDVLEHIKDDNLVLRNFYRALKNKGYIIIHSPSNVQMLNKGVQEQIIGEHYRNGYNIEEMRDKLQGIGFKLQEIRYTYGWTGHLAWRIGIRLPVFLFKLLGYFGLLLLVVYMPLILPLFLILNYIDTISTVKYGRGIYVTARKESAE